MDNKNNSLGETIALEVPVTLFCWPWKSIEIENGENRAKKKHEYGGMDEPKMCEETASPFGQEAWWPGQRDWGGQVTKMLILYLFKDNSTGTYLC